MKSYIYCVLTYDTVIGYSLEYFHFSKCTYPFKNLKIYFIKFNGKTKNCKGYKNLSQQCEYKEEKSSK